VIIITKIGRNNAERKNVEEELLNEKKFTEVALNAQRDTFFVFEPSTGKGIRWNKAFSEFSGYTNEEIANMKAPESYYSELDLKTSAKAIEKIYNEGTALLEMNLITKNGKPIPFEYLGTRINDDEGNLKYIVSIGRDITERKKSEEDYRSLIENFQGVAFQGYKDFSAGFFRGAVEEITGYTEDDFLTGYIKWNEIIHNDDISEINGKIREFYDQ